MAAPSSGFVFKWWKIIYATISWKGNEICSPFFLFKQITSDPKWCRTMKTKSARTLRVWETSQKCKIWRQPRIWLKSSSSKRRRRTELWDLRLAKYSSQVLRMVVESLLQPLQTKEVLRKLTVITTWLMMTPWWGLCLRWSSLVIQDFNKDLKHLEMPSQTQSLSLSLWTSSKR